MFTEQQIIGVLREHEAGAKAADSAHERGVPEATPHPLKGQVQPHGRLGGQASEATYIR